jgi:hypothetical protein
MTQETILVKKQGIFINLDALLDTRLGTLYLLDEEAMIRNLSGNYFKRDTDDFIGIDKNVFNAAYAARDKNTLKNSTICKIVNMIREIVKVTLKESISSPLHTGPKIFINTYPYKLLLEEENLIVKAVAAMTDKLADIELIYYSNENLTPKFIKENLAVLFMYEYGAWLDIQAENFKKTPCPEISLIVPELYFNKIPTKAELDQMLEKQLNPFKAIEIISAPLIGLKLYGIDLFCANIV